MTYGPDEVSRDLALIGEGTASFEVRVRLETHLLKVLQSEGTEALGARLRSIPGHEFQRVGDGGSSSEVRFRSVGSDTSPIVIDGFLGTDHATINVTVEDTSPAVEPDPRHSAFYDIWDSFVGLPDVPLADLDEARRAVYLVGLLEAELMNGGFGQYLANTEGAHLDETLPILASIGAKSTRTLLVRAIALGAGAETYLAAWDTRPDDFLELDEEFYQSGEDLAGLTADTFLE